MPKSALPFVWKLPLFTIGLLAIAYLSACLFLFVRQTRMIFFPSPLIETTPADINLPYRDIWIPVHPDHSSEQIHGWWIPSNLQNLQNGVLLYLHGNGINIGANVFQAGRFQQLGLSVLLIDYRGYGQSKGSFPSERAVYEDAQAAWRYLTQDMEIPPDQIFIYGHSLGGAIAIDLAIQHPEAAGLIVQSSFTAIRDMVDHSKPFKIFPVDLLLRHRFDSIRKVPLLQLPVLFIHGTADYQVPAFMSEALYAAAPNPKQLYLVPAAGHNDVAEIGGREYLDVVDRFIQKASVQR